MKALLEPVAHTARRLLVSLALGLLAHAAWRLLSSLALLWAILLATALPCQAENLATVRTSALPAVPSSAAIGPLSGLAAELPMGITGLIIAGILAAAMATLSENTQLQGGSLDVRHPPCRTMTYIANIHH